MAQAIDTSTCHLGFRCIVRQAEGRDGGKEREEAEGSGMERHGGGDGSRAA